MSKRHDPPLPHASDDSATDSEPNGRDLRTSDHVRPTPNSGGTKGRQVVDKRSKLERKKKKNGNRPPHHKRTHQWIKFWNQRKSIPLLMVSLILLLAVIRVFGDLFGPSRRVARGATSRQVVAANSGYKKNQRGPKPSNEEQQRIKQRNEAYLKKLTNPTPSLSQQSVQSDFTPDQIGEDIKQNFDAFRQAIVPGADSPPFVGQVGRPTPRPTPRMLDLTSPSPPPIQPPRSMTQDAALPPDEDSKLSDDNNWNTNLPFNPPRRVTKRGPAPSPPPPPPPADSPDPAQDASNAPQPMDVSSVGGTDVLSPSPNISFDFLNLGNNASNGRQQQLMDGAGGPGGNNHQNIRPTSHVRPPSTVRRRDSSSGRSNDTDVVIVVRPLLWARTHGVLVNGDTNTLMSRLFDGDKMATNVTIFPGQLLCYQWHLNADQGQFISQRLMSSLMVWGNPAMTRIPGITDEEKQKFSRIMAQIDAAYEEQQNGAAEFSVDLDEKVDGWNQVLRLDISIRRTQGVTPFPQGSRTILMSSVSHLDEITDDINRVYGTEYNCALLTIICAFDFYRRKGSCRNDLWNAATLLGSRKIIKQSLTGDFFRLTGAPYQSKIDTYGPIPGQEEKLSTNLFTDLGTFVRGQAKLRVSERAIPYEFAGKKCVCISSIMFGKRKLNSRVGKKFVRAPPL